METFSSEERRRLRLSSPISTGPSSPSSTCRGGQGRALRPLLPLGQVAPPALPRRVRRTGRRRRRRANRRDRPGRAALRARLLRVRRRFGGPARRRAPGLRGRVEHPDEGARVGPSHGLPRAIDALYPLYRPAGRPMEVPRSRRARRPPAPRPLRRDARPRVRDLRALDRADARALDGALPRAAGDTDAACA